MHIRFPTLIFAAAMMVASCSDKSKSPNERDGVRESEVEAGEDERQPDDDQISEDCVAFVRATKIVPAQTPTAHCPTCPAEGTDVFAFRNMKTDKVSCSGDTCTIVVTIRALFNSGSGSTIAGGLTAWIPPEQRSAYLSGHTPSGEQTYRAQITYKLRDDKWRAVEFDRAPAE